MKKTEEVLAIKGVEYGRASDRFDNFREIAKDNDCSLEKAALMLMYKQFIYVKGICNGTLSKGLITDKLINEKFGDVVNYLILIEGIVREKYDVWDEEECKCDSKVDKDSRYKIRDIIECNAEIEKLAGGKTLGKHE